MAAEKGLAFVLKLAAANVAGMRTTSMSINGEEVDVTNKDSGGWRELLAGAGTVAMDISASGVFQDNSNLATIRGYVTAQSLNTFVLEFESGDDYTGSFQVLSVEQNGDHNGELSYSIELKSSGVIAFTAA